MKQNKASPAKKSAKRELDRLNKSPNKASMKLVPAHISVDEVIGFNSLQATEENPSGQYVDPKTGLREYSRLSNVLRIPEIRNLFINTAKLMFSDEPLPPEIEEIQSQPMPGEEEGLIPIPSDEDPSVQKVAEAGTGQDEILVMMPQDVVHFLDILQGGENKDPEYGLQQFGGFNIFKPLERAGKAIGRAFSGNAVRSVIRTVSTVAGGVGGFMLGGPMGAAAGAYGGNMLGRGATGQNMFGGSNPAWKAAAPNALYGGAAGLGAASMGYGAAAGGAAAPIVNGAASTAPGVTAAATPYVAGAGGTPYVIGTGVAPSVAAPVAGGGLMSSMSGLSGYLPGAALIGAGFLMNKKGEKEHQDVYKKDKEDHEKKRQEQREYLESQRLNTHLVEHKPLNENDIYGRRPKRYKTGGSVKRELEQHNKMSNFKTGGMVKILSVKGVPLKGPGKGQEDKIHKSIPEYTWIHDAHTVGALGDGVTEEGQKDIAKFETMIKKEMLPLYKDKLIAQLKKNKPRNVKCAVANGERETPLLLVGALGKGSFEQGAKKLRTVTKFIRRHKVSKNDELPPASLGLSTYYKKSLGGK